MRRLLLLLALLLPTQRSTSQTLASWERRDENLPTKLWYRPHHFIVQTAGGQGLVTAGVGYTILRGHVDLDGLAGYVPATYSITAMGIFTGKVTYSPWTLPLGQARWQARPLSVGGLLSHTASQGLAASRGAKYPQDYYWWSSRTRLGGFLGGSVARTVGNGRHGHPRRVAAYYELGTNDLYVASLFTNVGGLRFVDILTLGLGVKVDL